jgi:NACalpha-BTF3-like transcription factor
MSLAVLADHMASKGRGPDSMLIHMSPTEVQGLQALAMKHGGSLTINPETGLPEAGFLDRLLPAIIGFGITAMTGIPAWQVGLGVGAVETVRTGDLGRGITAGLGAYGGAGLGAGMSAAGSSALGADANLLAAQQATELSGLESMSGAFGEAGATAGADAVGQATAGAAEAASPFEKISRGFDAAKTNPSSLLTKDNFKYLAAAAAPILAGEAVKSNMPQTVTKPGAIRPYSYDPYGGGFTAYPEYEVPKRAASGGIMGFDESANSPMSHQSLSNMQDTGGMFNYAHDGGGVMRMAQGGIAGYADGGSAAAAYAAANNIDLNKNINQWITDNPNANRATIDAEMNKYGISQDDVNRALSGSTVTSAAVDYGLSHGMGLSDINQNIANFTNVTNKNATDAQIDAAMSQYGISNEDVARALAATGGSQGEQYAVLAGNMGLSGLNQNINSWLAANPKATLADAQAAMTTSGINEADVLRATGKSLTDLYPKKLVCGDGFELNAAGTACVKKTLTCGPGYEPNAAGTACVKKTLTCAEGYEPNAAGTECVRKTTTDTKTIVCGVGFHPSIDGKSCVKDLEIVDDFHFCPTGQHWDASAGKCVANISATQETTTTVDTPTSLTTAVDTALPVGVSGTTGPSIIGGGSTVNPNGTITTSPVIPGIPVGGFTGMEDVRNAYTKGGGSLGYVPYAPKTMAEFNAKYNNLTGGSKQAYDYLTGKTPYSPTPFTPTGQIFKPYSEAMGIPQDLTKRMYIFDPATKTYKRNPDYKPPSYATAGTAAATAAALVNPDKQPTDDPGAGNKWTWSDVDKKWSATPIDGSSGNASSESSSGTGGDAAGGLMRKAEGGLAALTMAHGGMAEQFNLGSYSDGGRLLRGPGDGVSDSIPATIGNKRPARLADGEFVVPARIVSELGNGSTEAGARKLYAMMDRVQAARKGSIGKGKVANNSRSDKYLPA